MRFIDGNLVQMLWKNMRNVFSRLSRGQLSEASILKRLRVEEISEELDSIVMINLVIPSQVNIYSRLLYVFFAVNTHHQSFILCLENKRFEIVQLNIANEL